MILLRLFLEFCRVGLFSVGGGLATIPFLTDLGERTGWFTSGQLADMIAISESTPGPMGVNMATYVGFTTAAHGKQPHPAELKEKPEQDHFFSPPFAARTHSPATPAATTRNTGDSATPSAAPKNPVSGRAKNVPAAAITSTTA